MANYSYLADGTRTSAVGSDGSGLVRRGSLTYRKAVDGIPHDIDDGYNDTIEVSADEFWAMTFCYGSKLYDVFRDLYKDWYGYETGEGIRVLAASVCFGDRNAHHSATVIGNAFDIDSQYLIGIGMAVFNEGLGRLSKLFYNPDNNRWIGKNLKSYTFKFNGNQYTGGRLKWARTVSRALKIASKGLGLLDAGFSAYNFKHAQTNCDKWKYGVDLAVGVVSVFVPYVGIAYSIALQPLVHTLITNYYITKYNEALLRQDN